MNLAYGIALALIFPVADTEAMSMLRGTELHHENESQTEKVAVVGTAQRIEVDDHFRSMPGSESEINSSQTAAASVSKDDPVREIAREQLSLLALETKTISNSSSLGGAAAEQKAIQQMTQQMQFQIQTAVAAQVQVQVQQQLELRERASNRIAAKSTAAYTKTLEAMNNAVEKIDEVVTWSEGMQSQYPNIEAFLLASAMLLCVMIGFTVCWGDVEKLAVR